MAKNWPQCVHGITLHKQLYQLVLTAIQVAGLAEVGSTVCSLCPCNLQLCSDSIWCQVLLHRHSEFMKTLFMGQGMEKATFWMEGSSWIISCCVRWKQRWKVASSNGKSSLSSVKQHTMRAYKGVEVWLHTFIVLELYRQGQSTSGSCPDSGLGKS
jgi:hypothetical protein